MNQNITFTPKELMETITLIGACISAIIGMIGFLVSQIKAIKKPNEIQNERLDVIEKRLNEFEEYFLNDDKRIAGIEEGNCVTQKALLALLSHGIDGNAIEAMQKAKDELNEYLIHR